MKLFFCVVYLFYVFLGIAEGSAIPEPNNSGSVGQQQPLSLIPMGSVGGKTFYREKDFLSDYGYAASHCTSYEMEFAKIESCVEFALLKWQLGTFWIDGISDNLNMSECTGANFPLLNSFSISESCPSFHQGQVDNTCSGYFSPLCQIRNI